MIPVSSRGPTVPTRRCGALVLAALLAVPAACSGGSERQGQRSGEAVPPRVVLIGLDAADWLVIEPLVRAGELPTFARLMKVGPTGRLHATPPLISPMLWTTIATGQSPENHGVLDFMVDLPGGRQAPVGSANRLVPAMWNLFSDAGRRVAIVGWWATWPAESVRGVMVSDALAPQLTRVRPPVDGGVVSPPAMAARASSAVVTASMLSHDDLAAYVPLTRADFDGFQRALAAPPASLYRNRFAHLAVIVAATRTYSAIAEELQRTERPDLLAVYLEGIDTISHLFVRDERAGRQAIRQAYRDADSLIRRLAEASPPDTLVLVCSDHGFYPATAAIAEDPSDLTGPATAWHRPYGIVAAATAGAITGRTADRDAGVRPADVGVVTLLDVAPTVLHAAGLAVTRDMPGRVVTALLPGDPARREVRRVAAPKFAPQTNLPTTDRDTAEAWARLQALGYVGAVKTSLARQNLGEVLYRQGKLAAAERELRAVLEAQPKNLTALLWLAKAFAGQQRTGEALRAYEQAVALPGGARDGLVEAVDLALSAGDPERARRLVAAATGQRDATVATAVARGTIAEAAGDTRSAEQNYRAALKADPLSFDAAARLMELLAARGRVAEALPLLERACQLAPDSPRHLALLGEARLAAHDAPAAERALSRALVLAPDGDRVRVALARAQVLQGRSDAAVATLRAAAPSAERAALLGAAYSSAGQWTQAATEFNAAVNQGMATPDVLNGLAWAELKLGRTERARDLFTRSLGIRPDQPEIRKLVANIGPAPAGTSR